MKKPRKPRDYYYDTELMEITVENGTKLTDFIQKVKGFPPDSFLDIGGDYGSDHVLSVCFPTPEGRQKMKDRWEKYQKEINEWEKQK